MMLLRKNSQCTCKNDRIGVNAIKITLHLTSLWAKTSMVLCCDCPILLALATFGDITRIETILAVLFFQSWPRQVEKMTNLFRRFHIVKQDKFL
jgi:hypothetical protein